MADEVKLYGLDGSPFVCRVKIALNLKGIDYKFVIEEVYTNLSSDLIKYNPVHKKIPVLVHNGNPIAESLVIVEYIDEAWKGVSILPHDAYEKSQARFWAKFIDDKCIPTIFKAFASQGQEQEQAVAEAQEQLQFLENELKGKKFFGGDNINFVDISAILIAYWVKVPEELLGIKVVSEDKFPKLTEWSHNCINCQVVKENLPPKEILVPFFKMRFGN